MQARALLFWCLYCFIFPVQWLLSKSFCHTDIWQGDPQKIPKAVLHQLCQRSSWEAPKFNKVLGKDNGFCYAVSVLRKSSGRGKSRKAGGLTTLELPDQLEAFGSAEVLNPVSTKYTISFLAFDGHFFLMNIFGRLCCCQFSMIAWFDISWSSVLLKHCVESLCPHVLHHWAHI